MFRILNDRISVSPQITAGDVATAAAQGVGLIINNRPEDESEDQTPGDAIAAAARAAGLDYVAIPVTHAGFSEGQVKAMAAALAGADKPVLAYCRSGTRSTLLWALAEASRGKNPQALSAAASAAGYDLSPIKAMIDMLAANAD
ncbi:MAG: TIGR01244 family sulfur transferase [Novosphingobium sp.]